ncbi:hypothetical protein T4B_13199 [Trichinella pseudospiralis]|uniref:Uncharacterized protein n=2 Tax=Trichinella pseudospiralis TaxID=6337 RepID=A0A0V1FP87_TRIPS|nr:hypothetical protein T4E_3778 [Trichinella pseudospiralis]KRY87834.1 hypothetical protein T4D_2306 [Trichinella pseudospiralis]KRZ27896.1 hypothetical protein T4B_13199 [Trichinella pseudospiralis]
MTSNLLATDLHQNVRIDQMDQRQAQNSADQMYLLSGAQCQSSDNRHLEQTTNHAETKVQ